MKIIFYGPINEVTKTRQLFIISYTLVSEKYFVKLYNKIMGYKNVSFREITVMCDKKYLNCDILQNIEWHHFRCRVIQKSCFSANYHFIIVMPEQKLISLSKVFLSSYSLK